MREGGLEPPHPCEYWHLKPARLPIPPLAHVWRTEVRQPRETNTPRGCAPFESTLASTPAACALREPFESPFGLASCRWRE